MKKTLLLLIPIIALFSACKEKGYQYIEVRAYKNSAGEIKFREKEEFIPTDNDTLAYYWAYVRYCIALKISRQYSTFEKDTIMFMLISPDYRNITDIEFATKAQMKEEIEKDIFSMD